MEIDFIGIIFGIAFLSLIITNIYFVKIVFRMKDKTGFSIETGRRLKKILSEFKNNSMINNKYDVSEKDIKIYIYSRRTGFSLIGLALLMYLIKFA